MTKVFVVKIKFSSLEHILVDECSNEISISINELPIKGRANKAIIKIISKYFNIEPANIKIIRGLSAKTKLIEISWSHDCHYSAINNLSYFTKKI